MITRRHFLKNLAGAAAASTLINHPSFPDKRPKNLLIIMTEQQPTSTLGCYGNPLKPTPHLDRFASGGIRFSNCQISAFPCSPSRATLLTGCYPQRHGVFTNNIPLDDNIPSLGYILKNAGYATAYFGKSHLKGHMYRDVPWREPYNGSWYNRRIPVADRFEVEKIPGGLGEDVPHLGFDTWAGGWRQYHAYLKRVGLEHLLNHRPLPGNHQVASSAPNDRHRYSLIPEEHHMAAFFAHRAERFLRMHRGSSLPFFMVVSFYGPHLPVAPPKPWNEKFRLEDCPLPDNHPDTLEGKPESQRENAYCYKLPSWSEAQFRDYIRRYYGYAAYIDAQIGRILDALASSGFEEDTIVLFTSDHGDLIGAHGFVYKIDEACYKEMMNVPLLLRVPGRTLPGSVSRSLVGTVDIMPTLLDLLDLKIPGGVHGIPFTPALRFPRTPIRDSVFTHWGPDSIVAYDDRWKYGLHSRAEIDELYDTEKDPGELTNLIHTGGYEDIARDRRNRIHGWLETTRHPYRTAFVKKGK